MQITVKINHEKISVTVPASVHSAIVYVEKPASKFQERFAIDENLDGHGSYLMMTDRMHERYDNSESTAYCFTGMTAWNNERRLMDKMHDLKAKLGRKLLPSEVAQIELEEEVQ